jgi:hypothetical protein
MIDDAAEIAAVDPSSTITLDEMIGLVGRFATFPPITNLL